MVGREGNREQEIHNYQEQARRKETQIQNDEALPPRMYYIICYIFRLSRLKSRNQSQSVTVWSSMTTGHS